MAELQITIRPGAQYLDGDILHCHNDHSVKRVHGEQLCFPRIGNRLVDMDGNGIMPAGHISQDWCEAVCELRFERVSSSELIMSRIATGETVRIIDGVPFANPLAGGAVQHLHFAPFFAIRRNAQLFPVFGSLDREIVYGGNHDLTEVATAKVWTKIAEKTGNVPTDPRFKFWPKGDQDLKSFLCFEIPDVNDEEMESLQSAQQGANANAPDVRKRQHAVNNWRRFAGVANHFRVTTAAILDSTVTVDVRGKVPPLSDAVLIRDRKTNQNRPLKPK